MGADCQRQGCELRDGRAKSPTSSAEDGAGVEEADLRDLAENPPVKKGCSRANGRGGRYTINQVGVSGAAV